MKLYELIILIHPSLSTEESADLVSKVEGLFPGAIKQKDEIGYQTVYNVQGLKYGSKAYFLSYLLESSADLILEAKQKMSLYKGLVRVLVLGASKKVPFVNFNEVNALYEVKLSELATKDKKAKKTKDQKQQLLDTAKDLEIEITEERQPESTDSSKE